MDRPSIITRIEAADLPATTYRTARRLLDLVGDDGHVTLEKAAMLEICGTDKWATVRSHLGQLTRTGLIHYSTNAMVYVNFVIAERAQMTSERSFVTSERAQPDDSTRAERAQMTSERSNEPSLGRLGKVGRLGTDQTTYLPTLDDLTDEQRRAVALLTDPDVGLVEASAIEHATAYSWTHILRMVANWYTDVQDGDVTGPGALHTRLQRNWTVGPITADFRRSDLCARHAPEETADQIDHTDRRRYQISAA